MGKKVVPITAAKPKMKPLQERLSDFLDSQIGGAKEIEFKISVKYLREKLDVESYPRYRDFKQVVLRTCLNKYLESSDYNVYVGEEKLSREVHQLHFSIKHKDVDKDASVRDRRAAFYIVK